MSIGEQLKNLRIVSGYSKKQVSDLLKMPYTTYNNYETDAREAGSEALKKMAKLYDVTIDLILENEKPIGLDDVYLHLAQDAQESGIPPEDIKQIIALIKGNREKKDTE